ncbi:M36 family metallopeptidase [Spirillospora sp. NPDC047279]|uniref:M36 family metallopeptidase n=1 Tax=Spirillospora sp. NPDC047279 TaxID=3155478 RepID=UPI0033F7C650
MAIPDNFHALYDRDAAEAAGLAMPGPVPRHETGSRRLAERLPRLLTDYDGATGGPVQVWNLDPEPLGPPAPTPEAAVTGFVADRTDLWGLSRDDLGTLEVTGVSRTGLRSVHLVQRVGPAEVWGSEVTVAIDSDNAVTAVAGQMFPGAAGAPTAALDSVPAENAIARAAADLTGEGFEPSDFVPAIDPGSGNGSPYRFYTYAARDREPELERPVRVKDVLFPFGGERFVPGFYLELCFKQGPAFSYVVEAADTGQAILFRNNLTAEASFTYLVHNTRDVLLRPLDSPAPGTPHPNGTPNGFQASTVGEVAVSVDSLIGDPWLPATATTTQGNNCAAYADLVAPDGRGNGDVLGQTTSTRTFGNTYNHGLSATDPANLQNSLTGMFFHVNWLHDRWYAAGFDEGAGNAQQDNFGRGGAGADRILAEGNDFSGTTNANMLTPADGASPRMQMFLFPGPNPDRTSNHEALITFHEMGHYITNRLVGNANGLTNVQGRSMGEGWGDAFALVMTSRAGEDFARGAFAAGGWVVRDLQAGFTDNYYFGIRRYPYSARTTLNPLTFRHIGNNVALPAGPPITPFTVPVNAPNNEVHNAGEVWCSALWQVFVNLVARHRHHHAERRMVHYMVGGLKLTPSQPTFVQARDAFIQAVTAIDRTDLAPVWRGFATRGMGNGAIAPASNSTTLNGVTESFTVPAGLPDDEKIENLAAMNMF